MPTADVSNINAMDLLRTRSEGGLTVGVVQQLHGAGLALRHVAQVAAENPLHALVIYGVQHLRRRGNSLNGLCLRLLAGTRLSDAQ